MLLMIDNYDSFTYNLVHYFQELGQQVLVRRNDEIDCDGIAALSPSHLVISPGPCTPNEAGVSLAAVRRFAGQIPLLGVCLGHQTIGQAFGAQVVKAHRVMHGKTSLIDHQQCDLFRGLPQPLEVTRYHSLLLEPESLPTCLRITASCPQKETQQVEIMAIAHRSLAVYGVQFHPESVLSQGGHQLLANFLELT